jgi:hypothetical protein
MTTTAANRLPTLQPPSKSFTGSSAASIDLFDATKDAGKGPPVSSLDWIDVTAPDLLVGLARAELPKHDLGVR